MPRGDCQSQPCRCAQHGHFEPIARGLHPDSKLGIAPGPVVGSVTFSAGDGQELYDLLTARGLLGCVGDPPQAHPEMVEHVRRSVDDYVAGLPEVEDDAATVVELVQRGESWHIAISRGKMYHETAEDSLGAALDAVGRILGEKPGQSVDSCAEVPTDSGLDKTLRLIDVQHQLIEARNEVILLRQWRIDHEVPTVGHYASLIRAELLASLPPSRIDDPEALAKLTPSKVRAYLKGKGWKYPGGDVPFSAWLAPCGWQSGILVGRGDQGGWGERSVLEVIASYEKRSSAAVYLDILQTEPEAPSDPPRGYAP